MYCLVKKYEYEFDKEVRVQLFEIMQQVDSTLIAIFQQYLGQLELEVALQILHQVIKIFYTVNQMWLCPFLK